MYKIKVRGCGDCPFKRFAEDPYDKEHGEAKFVCEQSYHVISDAVMGNYVPDSCPLLRRAVMIQLSRDYYKKPATVAS